MVIRKSPAPATTVKKAVVSTSAPAKKSPAPKTVKVVKTAVKKGSATNSPPKKNSASQAAKPKKAKLVRDSFTMPAPEYAVIAQVKKACLAAGFEIKKSEILRIGIALIQKLDDKALRDVLATLPPLKAGRPKK